MIKLLLLFFLLFTTAFSKPLVFESGEERVNIIELYTSQGCNSCPVADEWLSDLKDDKELFKKFIPMAFHVTYWNFIGWTDTFAKRTFDQRQRYYSNHVWKKNSVYTPQFVVNTNEYRQWFSNQAFPKFENKQGGNLKLTVNEDNLDIDYKATSNKTKLIYVHVALLGFDYVIDIKSGENSNKTLHHDFVVLEKQSYISAIKNGKLQIEKTLPFVKDDGHRKAIAVWLSDEKSQIIQAVGGFLI